MTVNNKNDSIEAIKTKADIEIKRIEAESTAKEVTSKYIGKTAIPWIVALVVVGVGASAFLPTEALPAVIGLVSTAVMALITMLSGITGTKEKEEKPEFQIISSLIKNIEESKENLNVTIDKDKVTVSKGDSKIVSSRKE